MITSTLFTLLAALIISFATFTSALPTIAGASANSVALKAPTPGPRSLLGRSYLRHNLALANVLSRVILPTVDEFSGRADRFEVLQRRRAARRSIARGLKVHAQDHGDAGNNLLSNHTIVASSVQHPVPPTEPRMSSQFQAPLAVTTPPGPHPTRVGNMKHHAQKNVAAIKARSL
ncbi:hypothetical protein D9615_002049 [Tricholomella constricta]|uniref:Uncharacterized protein n=1 Tax=Tricholomella constricta TaxID=117010 RepID=A0A8H5HP45_9AGAR|nr:hypothetical protein D9615_002049 [Tricholomella constricta]